MISSIIRGGVSFIFAGAVFFTAFSASAEVGEAIPEMGDLERWAVFSLGVGNVFNRFVDSSHITGDVGAAGNGDINLATNATIEGDLYYRSNGALQQSGNATITGTIFQSQDSVLDNGVNEAIAASNAAASFQATNPISKIALSGNQGTTVTGAPGATVVLNLQSFQMSGTSTFTLQGTATTTFVINVTKQFSLSDSAKVVLAGGLQWNDVLFNVRGSGSSVQLSDQAQLQGILMATRRRVRLRQNSIVNGEIIANTIFSWTGSQVIRPPIVSP